MREFGAMGETGVIYRRRNAVELASAQCLETQCCS